MTNNLPFGSVASTESEAALAAASATSTAASKYDFDYLVIGGGSGGIASANRAAIRGARVLVVEGSNVGGTCVNLGCVPKKVLWNGAHMLELVKDFFPDYGFDVEVKKVDFSKLVHARQAYIRRIHDSYGRGFKSNGVSFLQGWAKLEDGHTVRVFTHDDQEVIVTAERILLAPGGKPSLPKVPGAEYGITSDDFFALDTLPKSVTVVGAGYIAVELAGVFAAFGVKTNLVVRGDRPLRWADTDLTDKLLENFKHQGINLIPGQDVKELVLNDDSSLTLVTTNKGGELKTTSECVVWAIGRHPFTSELGLENTKVKLDAKGFIETNELNETAEPSIYAIGDATHMPALTPVAIKAGRLLAERLFNQDPQFANAHYATKYVPTVIFTHPAIGTIGLSEEDALKKYGKYDAETNPEGVRVYKSNFASMISAITANRQTCFMKLVTQGPNELVVGLHGIGQGLDEIVQGFAVAMEMGATKKNFDDTVAIHPTAAEEFVTMR